MLIYPLKMVMFYDLPIKDGDFLVDLPIKNGDVL